MMDRREFVLKGVGAFAGLGVAGAGVACGGGDGTTDPGGNGGNGGNGGGNGGGDDNTVSVEDNFFSPQDLTISVGESVTWEHNGSALHNIVPDGHSAWQSREFPAGASDFTVTFNNAGTFDYLCEYHPPGMVGTITVE